MIEIHQTVTGSEALDAAIAMREEDVNRAAEAMVAAMEAPNPLIVLSEYVAELAKDNELIARLQTLHDTEEPPAKKTGGQPYM